MFLVITCIVQVTLPNIVNNSDEVVQVYPSNDTADVYIAAQNETVIANFDAKYGFLKQPSSQNICDIFFSFVLLHFLKIFTYTCLFYYCIQIIWFNAVS